jgi:hypothetical protein
MNEDKEIEIMMYIQEIKNNIDILEIKVEDSFDDKFDNVDEKVVDEE